MRSASTIAGSYIVGGLIPLSPYMLLRSSGHALLSSVVITLIALSIFGFIKGRVTGSGQLRGAIQTVLIGGIAAAAAFGLARLFSTE